MFAEIKKSLSNLIGWRTRRKIVVIESDDWGSIRMPSRQAYENLSEKGLILDKGGARYNKYDSLASKEDLAHLFDVLSSAKDKKGESAKFTPVSLVANPDFKKIKSSGFDKYYYEPFTKTLERHHKNGAFELWEEGLDESIFVPQFHGREHLNVQAWLRALKKSDKEARLAFDQKIWGYNRRKEISFQAAFDLEKASDINAQKEIVEDGLNLFEKIHGFKARYFVAPNNTLNNQLEEVAADGGIQYMMSSKIQKEVLGEGQTKTHFRYLGKKNKHKQLYLTRNVFFEPTGAKIDQVGQALNQIENAFKYKKPAVISSHRVNYVGGLYEENRVKSLKKLSTLLKKIVNRWPDVEFLTSAQLGDLIKDDKG